MSLPPRIEGFSYIGVYSYFLTFCTLHRRQTLLHRDVAASTLSIFRSTAQRKEFVILAYCVMPDHVHLLVEGETERADLRMFVKLAKQSSGAAYALKTGERLWQKGYYDRVLRKDEDLRELGRYILENPVRAGLVAAPAEYEFLGSDRWTVAELVEGTQARAHPKGWALRTT
jgi:putative transposase